VGFLGDTVFLASNSTRAVSSVSISILIGITGWDSLTPVSPVFEVNVSSAGSCINNVNVNTLSTIRGINVFVECAEV